MTIENSLKAILAGLLNLNSNDLGTDSPLLGHYPELDSMGIMTLLMEIEAAFSININSIELTADNFESFGALLSCVKSSANVRQVEHEVSIC
ncbi:MAG: acyl carrier protein [Psychrobium sp.]